MVDNEKLLQKLIDFTSEKHPAEYGEMLRESIVSIPVEKRVSPTKRKILTKQEMFKALEYGKKVTHNYFDNNEYLELTTEGYYKFEDGNITTPARFWEFRTETYWETGWKIFGE